MTRVARGRTARGRLRAEITTAAPKATPLLSTEDDGRPVRVYAHHVGAQGDRWIDPFLVANADALRRLGMDAEAHSAGGLHLELRPGGRIGAMPLLAPSTRRVAAGLLVRPRFRWSALGEVLSAVGFSVLPQFGGSALVPGSAREVPPWLIAGPVLRRLDGLLRHRRSAFIPKRELRLTPRGRVDWGAWIRSQAPMGRWTSLPCDFSEPADDPALMAAVRWTLHRLDDDLTSEVAGPARQLRAAIDALRAIVGEGPSIRPDRLTTPAFDAWVAEAVEAMGWVAEERGLGGSRELDGIAWDLAVADVWEAWVRSFARDLAPRLGLRLMSEVAPRRQLRWQGTVASMGSLAPDVGLRAENRVVWIDAKYKAHLTLLARHGWSDLTETTKSAHRADLHQALAYAALAEVDHVDTLLLYPSAQSVDTVDPQAVATLASGSRRVRLVLGVLPFGFRSPIQREAALNTWREALAA